jgi:hypothetical protein
MDQISATTTQITIGVLDVQGMVGSWGRIGDGVPLYGNPVGTLSVHDGTTGWKGPNKTSATKRLDGVHLCCTGAHAFFPAYLCVAGDNRDFNHTCYWAGGTGTGCCAQSNGSDGASVPLDRNAIGKRGASVQYSTIPLTDQLNGAQPLEAV